MTRRKKRPRGGATMLCGKCKTPTRVLRTTRDDRGEIVRERTCPKCGHAVETREKRA